ncbi:hypothetical protein [Actinopolymorpha rutila]|uniref:NHLP leader peptide domain-containing protein n=1 Tax=Actinopolymorpha rutila TaxID=446787 RepID=A0A852ZCG8_9ACTN|nr:hypothetical protein [Actinopolymorpha rutila]NYH89993.1 hypothetical protein [Actinopolymorpha rutila]
MVHPSQLEFCRLWGRLMARAWDDPEFGKRLAEDPAGVLAEHGYVVPEGMDVRLQVVASDEETVYLYVPSPGELTEVSGAGAGDVAAECVNNRLALDRLGDAVTGS